MTRPTLAVVGASWGGLHAVGELLSELDARCNLAVAVAQHRAADTPAEGYVRSVQARCALPVLEAEDKMAIEPGRVYVAPSDYHLLVDDDRFALSLEGAVRFSRPSIDVLFETAAESYGTCVVAVVLTGANDDGCRGALAVKEAGGIVLAQDPASAERAEMPASVIGSGAVDRVLAVPEIARALNEMGGVLA
ncbi:MAG TPA: chemotaxis protein CheB [Acidimicrobiales bacterium]|nr:chemotaxis protein CheB [Acidimicrobiales bacterium]